MKTEPTSVTIAEFPCAVCGARLDSLHLEPGRDGTVCAFCGAPQSVLDEQLPMIDRESGGPERRSFPDVGDALRNERQRRGEGLEEVAMATRIRETYLADLEDGAASFEPYPGRVYGRFFLREYAQYLGLDPAPLVRAFDGDVEPEPTIAPRKPVAPRQRTTVWALLASISVVMALLAGLRAVAFSDGREQERLRLQAPAGAITQPPGARQPHVPFRAGSTHGIRAVATMSGLCWIEAVADGETIYRRTATEGSTLVFRADRTLEITLGNAGGASLEVNGSRFETGDRADVVRLSFAWRDHRLVLV